SDRFSRKPIGIWLNDGNGHFVQSPPGRFSTNSGSNLVFVELDLNWAGQPTVDEQRRRLPDYLPAAGYIQSLPLKRPSLNDHQFKRLFHLAAGPPCQRGPPPTASAV